MEAKKGFFGNIFKKKPESRYSTKVNSPIYEPKELRPPGLFELFDRRKTKKLIRAIKNAKVSEKEKDFLIFAAYRHVVFNFDKIAEYYAHASKEMQELMEDSALVIIDFDKAIEKGYVTLSEEIASQYLKEYGDDKEAKEK